MRYSFKSVERCNMCGSGDHKILGRRLNSPHGLNPKSRVGISTTVMKCRDCGLIFSNPLPVPANIDDHYGIDPETYWQTIDFNIPSGYFKKEFQQMEQLAPNAQSFLDIGAGTGKTMDVAIERGYDVSGIEPSLPFYEKARARVGDRVQHAMVEDAVFPEESFDIISFGAVLEHLYDPAGSIEKSLKWLRPGGIIHIEVPSSDYLFSKLFNLYFWLSRTDYVGNISPMHPPFHLYEFSEKSFRRHGDRVGYSIAYLERFAGVTIMPRLTNLLVPIMNATGTGMELIVYIRKL
jgi:SAM-dependent methyltransferase